MKIQVVHGERHHEVEVRRISADEYRVEVNGRSHDVELLVREQEQQLLGLGDQVEHLVVSGRRGSRTVAWRDRVFRFQIRDPKRLGRGLSAALSEQGAALVKAQMPGKVVAVLKNSGDDVEAGEGLAIVESMKMQNELKAPRKGTITVCSVAVDASIESGQVLFQIE